MRTVVRSGPGCGPGTSSCASIGDPVATVQEFQAAVADARALALHIQRGDTRLFAIVR